MYKLLVLVTTTRERLRVVTPTLYLKYILTENIPLSNFLVEF
jgi:hypothetical protein